MPSEQHEWIGVLVLSAVGKLQVRRRDRDDAIQEGWRVALEELRSCQGRGVEIDQQIVHKAIMRALCKLLGKQMPIGEESLDEIGNFAAPDRTLEQRDFIEVRMKLLNDEERRLIELIYFKGSTVQAAAESLGMKQKAAYSRLKRAKEKMRGNL